MGQITEESVFDYWYGQGVFFPFLSKEFKLAVEHTQPSIKFKWVLGALALEVKWPVVEGDHLPPSGIRLRICAFSVVLH